MKMTEKEQKVADDLAGIGNVDIMCRTPNSEYEMVVRGIWSRLANTRSVFGTTIKNKQDEYFHVMEPITGFGLCGIESMEVMVKQVAPVEKR